MAEDNDNGNNKDKGKMTVEEAGKKGGKAVIDKYGPEHMAEIGRKGGEHSHGGRDGGDDGSGRQSDNDNNNSKRGLASADKEKSGEEKLRIISSILDR